MYFLAFVYLDLVRPDSQAKKNYFGLGSVLVSPRWDFANLV